MCGVLFHLLNLIFMATIFISKDLYEMRDNIEKWYFDNIIETTRCVQSIVTTIADGKFHTVCTWF